MPHYGDLADWNTNFGTYNPSAHGQSFDSVLKFDDTLVLEVNGGPNPPVALAALSPLVHTGAFPTEEVVIVYEKIEWTYNEDGSADLTAYSRDSPPDSDGSTAIHVDDPSVQSLRDALVQLVADADLLT